MNLGEIILSEQNKELERIKTLYLNKRNLKIQSKFIITPKDNFHAKSRWHK